MRAMRRQLWSVLTDKEHKVTLVHSKHHGWLAIGLTAFALGTAGISLATSGQVVHASDQPATSQQSQTNNGRVWTLRPVRLRRRLRRRIARFMIFSGVTHFRRSARR